MESDQLHIRLTSRSTRRGFEGGIPLLAEARFQGNQITLSKGTARIFLNRDFDVLPTLGNCFVSFISSFGTTERSKKEKELLAHEIFPDLDRTIL
jgi:hypothetical protein